MTGGPASSTSGVGPGADTEAGSATPRLECRGVTVRFGGLVAVKDVELSVPAGTIVGLVGPNGAGKSTLFGVMSGLIRPSGGRVLLDGEDVTDASPQLRASRGLARTFQHPELFTGLTVRDHLVLAHRVRHQRARIWSDLFTMGSLRGGEAGEADKVGELIGLLGLEAVADRPALGLPLGFARLVEMGRALATSPRVLLLDEPSSGLDSSETEQFESTLRRVAAERQISVLLVEHDVELVMRMCSTVNVLDFGTLIACGHPDDVRSNPAVRAAYLGEEVDATAAPDAPRSEEHSSGNSERDPGPTTVTVRPDRDDSSNGSGSSSRPAAVSVEDVSLRYGDALALSGVTFDLQPGKVLAVIGPNGAGKSSLARAVSGLVPISGGRILIDGKDISSWSAHRVRRAGVVHLPEGRGVFRSMNVLDNLRMAAAAVPSRQGRRQAVDLALDTFPVLADRRRQTAGLLSGGEQQMLSLARALATSPNILVADEMSLGLAPKMVDLVFEGLARARAMGVTVIMIEQYVHRALGFADDCLVLQRGTVAWSGAAGSAGTEVLSHYLGSAMTATG